MALVNKVSRILVIIGAINWGLVGAFNYNLVAKLFGSVPTLLMVVLVLVGIAGVYELVRLGSGK
ncbi:DUF378 domain-containing protein [Candidatus Gracilibacteria bacterium]|nr:DUF378 domain-containing protein [Candidatus Gracilibacteria bacterium]